MDDMWWMTFDVGLMERPNEMIDFNIYEEEDKV